MKKTVTIEYEQDGDTYERTETVLVTGKSGRGFGRISFVDRYGSECSLQDSSLATEPAIWFGVEKIEPKIMVPGQGWKPVPFPPDTLFNDRMHLTQSMVKQLLPFLIQFAETGSYVTQMEEFKNNPVTEEA